MLLLGVLLFSSCATRDQVVYFLEPEDIQGMENVMDYEPVIEKNDVLRIDVSSRDQMVVEPFQMNFNSGQGNAGGGQGQNQSLQGYLVDPEGYIHFPVFGEIMVAGKKRGELREEIENKIHTMAPEAVVRVRIMNFKVTVLGEVSNPGRVQIQDERITIPELLAEAGDISYNGKRENILVIREVDGEKSYGRVDITSSDVFQNPFYYLKQNDIVYVEPTYRQMKTAGFFGSYTGVFSLIASLTSLIFIFTR